jgi:long-chain acyl-CoA synthetase
MTFEDAVAVLTGPGAPFEISEAEVLGQPSRIFTNLPPTLRSLFEMLKARPADDVYIVFEDERWTNAEVLTSINEIAHVLVERYGVKKGDRVAINMRNFPEWITAFGAATSIGAIAVSVNAWWTGPEIEFGLVDAGAKVLITDRERVDRIGDRLAALNIHGLVIRAEGELPAGCDHLADVVTPGAPMPVVDVATDDDATILFTSGTTGVPKGAVSTNRAVLSGLFAFACRTTVEAIRWAPDTPPDPATTPAPIPPCFILTVPLFHVTGCVPVMLGSVATGAKLVMMHKWDPLRALQLIDREKVTNFVGVPTMSHDLISHPDFEKYDTSSLKNVGGGGAPVGGARDSSAHRPGDHAVGAAGLPDGGGAPAGAARPAGDGAAHKAVAAVPPAVRGGWRACLAAPADPVDRPGRGAGGAGAAGAWTTTGPLEGWALSPHRQFR